MERDSIRITYEQLASKLSCVSASFILFTFMMCCPLTNLVQPSPPYSRSDVRCD